MWWVLKPTDQTWMLWERWDLVVISTVVHLLFLFFFISSSFVKPKKVNFRSKGIIAGFIIALYFEMYGVPLTIYLLQPLLPGSMLDFYPLSFPLRIVGSMLIFLGFIVMYFGWKKIHAISNSIVCTGIYAYVRHPQYLGLALVTLGQLVQWPTVTGMILWPLLLVIYYKLALFEEKDVEKKHGDAYREYRKVVPGFFPSFKPYVPHHHQVSRKAST